MKTLDNKPFVVALYCGHKKPSDLNAFLSDFVTEILSLKDDHADIGYPINIKAFVCDTPARVFLKGISNYNAYNGCEKCTVHGKYIGRITFPECDASKREDTDFVSFYEGNGNEHISIKSPLIELGFGMVSQFPLDYMHLVCLGVMRKLLVTWLRGPLGTRLCSRDVDTISQRLVSFSNYMPEEIVRKPRTLRELDRWKATEFRTFLLYSGPVALKDILRTDLYHHFLAFHVSITIFCKEETIKKYLPYAKELLVYFVQKCKNLYGPEFIIYNVHNLIHLGDDVKKFGPLDTFSAFPFESYLGYIKRLLRTPNKPLQQVCRRLLEREKHEVSVCDADNHIDREKTGFHVVETSMHEKGPTAGLRGLQFKVVKKDGFVIKCSTGNNCVMLDSGTIICILNFVIYENNLFAIGKKFNIKTQFFSDPCSSSAMNIFYVSHLSIKVQFFPISSVQEKGILLPHHDGFVYIPLTHTKH